MTLRSPWRMNPRCPAASVSSEAVGQGDGRPRAGDEALRPRGSCRRTAPPALRANGTHTGEARADGRGAPFGATREPLPGSRWSGRTCPAGSVEQARTVRPVVQGRRSPRSMNRLYRADHATRVSSIGVRRRPVTLASGPSVRPPGARAATRGGATCGALRRGSRNPSRRRVTGVGLGVPTPVLRSHAGAADFRMAEPGAPPAARPTRAQSVVSRHGAPRWVIPCRSRQPRQFHKSPAVTPGTIPAAQRGRSLSRSSGLTWRPY
jgi:hypothetical protein